MENNSNYRRAGKAPEGDVDLCDHLSETPCLAPSEPKPPGIFDLAVGRPLGKMVLAVCPGGRKECNYVQCSLRPLCLCARQELDEAATKEARVWLAVTLCGALVILIAFVWALFF